VSAFPVVLFDLDGTVVDSGAIILASMRHATRQVLGIEASDQELMAAVGGPGLEAQMAAFAPDRVDELVRVYRAHNEPLHDELEPCEGMEDVIERLHAGGTRLGVAPQDCAYVGDSPFDIRAAKAAHMYAVAVTWGRIHDCAKLEAEEPAAIVDTAEALYERL
jgi:pyrophosphatase PpaX